MKRLKLFLSLLMLMCLSMGNVWGTSATWTLVEASPSDWSGEYLIVYGDYCFNGSLTSSFNGSSGQSVSISTDGKSITLDDKYAMIVGDKSNSTYSLKTASGYYLGRQSSSSNGVDANATYTSSTLGVSFGSWNGTNKTVKIAGVGGKCLGSNSNSWKFFASSNAYVNVKMFKKDSGSSNPTLSLDPTSKSVAATSVANQSVALTASNFASAISSVTTGLYSNAECTSAITSGQWVKDITVNAGKTAVTFNVDDNDGNQRQCWLKITASDGSKNASAILPITQAKYKAPTGTFNKFTGSTLTDGYYVICSGSTTTAMKSKATSAPRIDVATVTITNNNKTITNPDDSVVWKLEHLTGDDAAYFTLYNEETQTYAAFTSTDGRGTLIATVTDYAKFSHTDETSYDFENKGKTGKYLRFNSGYGFASYSNSTGAALTLYKKAGAPKAITIDNNIANGSVGVSSPANLSAVAEGTEVALTNTPASGYKLTAYDVYKTGASATKVTVTNGKFSMPDYDVTISATFEATKTLTGITLSGEYPTVFLTGDAFSHEGMTVTANYDDESTADVTSSATFTGYNMSSASAQTVTVSYTEGSTETATYGITVKDAYTVTEILPLVPALNAGSLATRVKGYISQIDSYNSTYNSITYWISADGKTTSDQLEVYSGKNVGNTNFSSINDLAVGDFVTISGSVKTHTNGVKEFDKNNYIITGGRIQKGAVTSVVVSGTATKTTYSANETFETTGLVVTVTYANGFSTAVTEGITWGDNLTDHKVVASGNVAVTATVGGQTSAAYNVAVTVAAKTLVSIAATPATKTIYTGEVLPKPTIMATFSEGEPEDVSAFAVYDTESAFNTATIDNPDPQTITVSYTFGGETKTTTYTVSVKDYANDAAHPYTPEQARYITINAVGSTMATKDIYVQGKVSQLGGNISSGKWGYYISADGTTTNQFQIYNGYYLNGANFTNANKLHLNDEVIVKGKVVYFNSATPEFATGESQVYSLARAPEFTIEDVASLEVGATDLAVSALTVNRDGEGAVTLASSGNTNAVTIVDGKLHAVAVGTATITANLAANGIYKAASTTFDVTVIAATVKYAITFDGNGADGGSAPEAIADKAAGVSVTLPANDYTYTGHVFGGWKVFYVDGESVVHQVAISENAFTMPACNVTIQAQWEEIPPQAYIYTSNITVGTDVVQFSDELEAPTYAAKKTGTGSNYGSTTVTVPYGTTKLHFHAVCYGADTYAVTLKVKNGENVLGTFNINKDAGAKGNSPFTLENTPYEQYYSVNLTNITEPTTITFEAESGSENGKRFIIFGVNQEGGLVPVLDRIVVTGDLSNKIFDAGDRFDSHEFDGLGANAIYKLGEADQTPVAVDFDDIEWSSDPEVVGASTESVAVTANYGGKSANKVITGLTVNVPDPEIEVGATSLAFGKVVKGATVADKELSVTLKSVENATLAISGDGASAFSVDPESMTATGTVTVSASSANVGTFEATLTISDDASQAEAQEVALSITVEAADDLSGTWNLVTNEADLMPGMQVIIASIAEGNAVTTMGKQAGTNEDGNNRVGVTGNSVSGTVLTPVAGTKVFTLVDAGNGKLAFQGMNGKYLYAASSSNNQLKQQAINNANGEWSISIEDNVATITAPGSSNRNLMRFNPNNGNPIFACYASSSTTGTLVTLYAKAFDYEREIPQGQLSTTCLPNGGKIVGASIFEVAYMDYEADGTTPHKIYFDEVEGGIMEAGVPYIVLANEGSEKFGVYYSDNVNKTEGLSSNGLVGYIGDGKYLAKDDYFIYNNMFYYVSATDAANERIHISSNRAYINLSAVPGYNNEPISVPAPGRRRMSMGNGSAPKVPTGMESVQQSEVSVQKVMIDGQLFILRGEQMYDAIGRLVK